jgi:hypothetical protein
MSSLSLPEKHRRTGPPERSKAAPTTTILPIPIDLFAPLRPVRTRDAGFHRILLSLEPNFLYVLPISQCNALTILNEDDHRYIRQRCCEVVTPNSFCKQHRILDQKSFIRLASRRFR